tara:strand:+ start:911 stop:1651 length:741 start_codon:yes stop_codon:yes gene_type:complete
MECVFCNKPLAKSGACNSCTSKVRRELNELPDFQYESGFYIEPGRSGSGSPTSERSIGVNISALDFSMATDLLRTLHSWEVIIRNDRHLTPPALLRKEHTIDLEVQKTCNFHCVHLDWSLEQSWAVDFANEVHDLHARGKSAAKRFSEQPRRIPCPTDDCKRFVVIDVQHLMQDVNCLGCKQSWSVLRLVALAMNNERRRFFLDVEAIALWLGITERAVYQIIKNHQVDQRGKLYDLSAIVRLRTG